MNYENISEGFLDKKLFITATNLFYSNDIYVDQSENLRVEKTTLRRFSKKNLIGLTTNPEVFFKSNSTETIQIKY